jgi:hypothetical protein
MSFLTDHARLRLAQRGIPDLLLPILEMYGDSKYQDGAEVRFFTKKGRRRAHDAIKFLAAHLDSLLDVFSIADSSQGRVITAGHHYRRIRAR